MPVTIPTPRVQIGCYECGLDNVEHLLWHEATTVGVSSLFSHAGLTGCFNPEHRTMYMADSTGWFRADPSYDAEMRDLAAHAEAVIGRMRFAVVGAEMDTVNGYLPVNYETVAEVSDTHTFVQTTLITGVDRAGWTLDAYVIPRLQSGMYAAYEIDRDAAEALLDFDPKPVAS